MRMMRLLVPCLALAALACGEDLAMQNAATCRACSADATCQAKPDGTKQCVCKDGFTGDGKSCTARKRPDPAVCATCAADATCALAADGTTTCTCHEGYEGNGLTCRKTLDSAQCGGCDAQASCRQSASGASACVCDPGFVGDGKSCHAPADCDDFHGGCHAWATCEMVGGAPRCTCAYGTVGDGRECLPPSGAYVELKGTLGISYGKGNASCEAAWSFDIPMLYDGHHYTAQAKADVWELTSSMDLVDSTTGQVAVSLAVHAWQNVGACNGDFRFATDPDGVLTWTEISPQAPLTWFGDSGDWSWASSNGAQIHEFSGGLGATFHAP